MKKPKSKASQLAEAKRGLKRSIRLKKTRAKVAIKRKKIAELKKAQDRKIAKIVDQYLKTRAEKELQ